MEFINKGIENPWEKYDVSLRDFISDYKFDELFDEFHSWFDLVGYYHAKAKIGPIVSASRISNEQVSTYFDEIKEAYAFGQYRSSIALSRALLEMSLFDKLKRKGAFKQSSNKVVSIDVAKEDSLFKFINQAERFGILNHKMASLAHEVRKSANRVLHLKTADPDSDLPENRGTPARFFPRPRPVSVL
jgi:3-methyladenine DNA glycosylase AlkD